MRATAETLADVRQAKGFGAEGIGLFRTEHMFFEGQRIVIMRQIILATDEADRREALDKLFAMQKEDFQELFHMMDGKPVTIRLLNLPLHKFIPRTEAEMDLVAQAAGVPLDGVRRRAAELQEANPMLGHRGCRLAITYPEICEMQARAIFEAAVQMAGCLSWSRMIEVMLPWVATVEELKLLKGVIEKTADDVKRREFMLSLPYEVGTMIELPPAALQAGMLAFPDMAELADFLHFFIFGMNEHDPFVSLDPEGVGQLINMAVQHGRSARPEMKFGICGEHVGGPASIEVCEKIGLDYVSCSPFRVPGARVAAAQRGQRRREEAVFQFLLHNRTNLTPCLRAPRLIQGKNCGNGVSKKSSLSHPFRVFSCLFPMTTQDWRKHFVIRIAYGKVSHQWFWMVLACV